MLKLVTYVSLKWMAWIDVECVSYEIFFLLRSFLLCHLLLRSSFYTLSGMFLYYDLWFKFIMKTEIWILAYFIPPNWALKARIWHKKKKNWGKYHGGTTQYPKGTLDINLLLLFLIFPRNEISTVLGNAFCCTY